MTVICPSNSQSNSNKISSQIPRNSKIISSLALLINRIAVCPYSALTSVSTCLSIFALVHTLRRQSLHGSATIITWASSQPLVQTVRSPKTKPILLLRRCFCLIQRYWALESYIRVKIWDILFCPFPKWKAKAIHV